MSNYPTNIDEVSASQEGKDAAANALLAAASPAMVHARRESTSALLVWGYYGGAFNADDGTIVLLSAGTVSLTGSATNYVQAHPTTGVVSANTSGFTAGYRKLYTVTTNSTAATGWTDYRAVGGDGASSSGGSTINKQTGSSYTLQTSDLNDVIVERENASSNTTLVPANMGSPGDSFTVVQTGAGTSSITAESGVDIRYTSTLAARARWATMTLYCRAANEWVLAGETA